MDVIAPRNQVDQSPICEYAGEVPPHAIEMEGKYEYFFQVLGTASDFFLFLQLLFGGQAIITTLIMSHRYYAIKEAQNGPPKKDIDILKIDRDKLRRQSSQGLALSQIQRDKQKADMNENLVLRSKIDGRELPARVEGEKAIESPILKPSSDKQAD